VRFLNVSQYITCIILKKVSLKIINHLLPVLIGLACVAPGFGQKYEIGAGMGGAVYSGDIIRKIDPGQTGLQGTLFGKRNFDNVWTLRVGLGAGVLQGDDEISRIDRVLRSRDARFKGGVIELSAVMEFNFLDYLRHDPEFRFSPYAFFGVGYSFFTMKGRYSPEIITPADFYQLSSAVIPFGGGVKYRLNDQWTLAAEIGFRPTTTDYLDKIDSKNPAVPRYQPAPNPANGNIPPYGINFGNPYTKDWYYFAGLTISYAIFNSNCYGY
jgi:hypothetical protein